MIKKIKNSGFTLIETLVAVTILTLGIVGPLELAYRSISYTKLSQNQIVASYLAQEGVELVRHIRDTNKINGEPNWLKNLDKCIGSKCYIDAQSASLEPDVCGGSCPYIKYSDALGYNYSSPDPTIFIRNITIDNLVGGTEARINVSVVWNEKIGQKRTDLEETIYNIP